MEIQRRNFLGTLATGALAASADAHATESAAVAAGNTWDVSWTARLNGKHRAVFDSPQFSGGAGLHRAVVWRRQYKAVYGTAPEEMNGVLVLRAEGIWLVMNDAFWTDYKVGEEQNFKHGGSGKFHVLNPIAGPSSQAQPESADMNIPSFLASGNILLACHLAFGAVVDMVKRTDKVATDEEAEKKAMSFVVPGVIMQPSGVFATLRAQEAGCSYILAS